MAEIAVSVMRRLSQLTNLFATELFALGFLVLAALPIATRAQDSGAEGTMLRGDRAEISVTVKDRNGAIIKSPGTVKLFRSGTPMGQASISQGRAFFILPRLGDYTVTAVAAGYKPGQQDISVMSAVRIEADVYLEPETEPNTVAGIPAGPVLAPKAKEAFDKGIQELRENKIDAAEKHINEAAKLAPSNPDVLYIQGVVFLKKKQWSQAQTVLEKATQLDPNNAHSLSALGMALTDQGKYEAAIPALEKSIQLDANTGYETQWALGKSYYYGGKYDEALKTSQEALKQSNGNSPEIELLVAQSLTAVGRFDEAGEALRNFLKNHANDPQAPTAKRWLDRLIADGKIKKQ
jgi:Flp pilus assembly protein TadD